MSEGSVSCSEEVLFTHDRCHVFRLPPANFLVSEQWEGNHIWTGRVKIVRSHFHDGLGTLSSSVVLEEIDANGGSGDVFGVCPLRHGCEGDGGAAAASVQQASDSSRCFVIRVEHEGRFAYVGLNFEQKPDAFRFLTSVVEQRNRQQGGVAKNRSPGPCDVPRTLKQDERIQIDIAGKLKSNSSGTTGRDPLLVSRSGGPLLQPPKASTATAQRRIVFAQQASQVSPVISSSTDGGVTSTTVGKGLSSQAQTDTCSAAHQPPVAPSTSLSLDVLLDSVAIAQNSAPRAKESVSHAKTLDDLFL
jgi:hypothetical protein